MPIYTCLGPIEPHELGPTTMHEHLLDDATVWATAPSIESLPQDAVVKAENLGFLAWNANGLEDNLRLDDPALALDEVKVLEQVAGAGLVDLTVVGLGRRAADVVSIARGTQVHVMLGCGFYVHDTHPEWAQRFDVDEFAEYLLRDLNMGVDGTGVLPAIIGEIGTSNPPTDRERRIVMAAGRAGALTGTAVNVHLDPYGHHGLSIIRLLLDEGLAADRIVLSHLDCMGALDHDYHREIAASGAILEFDNWGLEPNYGVAGNQFVRNNTDFDRLRHVQLLVQDGYADQLVHGVDVYSKRQLRRFGGFGYGHLLTHVVPVLRRFFDVDQASVTQMLVDTPRRLLDRPAPNPR
jgi:phosphotriesterase-related protein